MNNNDIEKLRPLANNSEHLVEIAIKKMQDEANKNGHLMNRIIQDGWKDINGTNIIYYTACENCSHYIEIELYDFGEEYIGIKEYKDIYGCNEQ